MTKRDAAYARISDDDAGTEKGVTRQIEDARTLSVARDGEIVMECADDDISALHGAQRDGYDELMAAVDAGQVDRVIVYQTSRLWRNRRERADGIERLRRAGVSVLPVKGTELDMTSASGRMMAGILGEFDTADSEVKGELIARAAQQRAEEGRTSGGVLYGWRRLYEHDSAGRRVGWEDVENHGQAEIVREIVKRLLAKESLIAITADLNARGVPAPRAGDKRKHRAKGQTELGEMWGKTSVRKLAVRPANVALRVHHRGRPDERLLPAAWPALISRDDHDAVVSALLEAEVARGPRRGVERAGARKHMLTWGIGECGVCHAHLRTTLKGNQKYGTKQVLYMCEARGCVGRNEAKVDEFIGDVMIARLRRPDIADLLDVDQAEQVKLLKVVEGLRARLARLADDCAEDRITDDQLRIMTAKLRPKLQGAEAAARRGRPSPHLKLVTDLIGAGDEAAAMWKRYDVNQKRAVIDILAERIRILPVARRGPGFDPKSVKVDWRGRRAGGS